MGKRESRLSRAAPALPTSSCGTLAKALKSLFLCEKMCFSFPSLNPNDSMFRTGSFDIPAPPSPMARSSFPLYPRTPPAPLNPTGPAHILNILSPPTPLYAHSVQAQVKPPPLLTRNFLASFLKTWPAQPHRACFLLSVLWHACIPSLGSFLTIKEDTAVFLWVGQEEIITRAKNGPWHSFKGLGKESHNERLQGTAPSAPTLQGSLCCMPPYPWPSLSLHALMRSLTCSQSSGPSGPSTQSPTLLIQPVHSAPLNLALTSSQVF